MFKLSFYKMNETVDGNEEQRVKILNRGNNIFAMWSFYHDECWSYVKEWKLSNFDSVGENIPKTISWNSEGTLLFQSFSQSQHSGVISCLIKNKSIMQLTGFQNCFFNQFVKCFVKPSRQKNFHTNTLNVLMTLT